MSAPVTSGVAAQSAAEFSSVAHEVRQPLSTIESIAYYLSLVLPRGDEKVHEQLGRIQALVEQASWILTNAQQLSDFSPGVREPVDVEELIHRAVALRFAPGDLPSVEFRGDLPSVTADPGLITALIDNVLMLFRAVATHDHPLTVRASSAGCGIRIELETGVPGFRQETSLCPGASVSVESARRMVAAQGGSLDLEIDASSGIRLRVMLP